MADCGESFAARRPSFSTILAGLPCRYYSRHEESCQLPELTQPSIPANWNRSTAKPRHVLDRGGFGVRLTGRILHEHLCGNTERHPPFPEVGNLGGRFPDIGQRFGELRLRDREIGSVRFFQCSFPQRKLWHSTIPIYDEAETECAFFSHVLTVLHAFTAQTVKKRRFSIFPSS
jgi:hypothetical protein